MEKSAWIHSAAIIHSIYMIPYSMILLCTMYACNPKICFSFSFFPCCCSYSFIFFIFIREHFYFLLFLSFLFFLFANIIPLFEFEWEPCEARGMFFFLFFLSFGIRRKSSEVFSCRPKRQNNHNPWKFSLIFVEEWRDLWRLLIKVE